MPKTHFLVSEIPQKFDASVEVLCGATLKNPQSVMAMDMDEMGLPDFRPLKDCHKCTHEWVKVVEESHAAPIPKYFYLLMEGQEVKNARAESAA